MQKPQQTMRQNATLLLCLLAVALYLYFNLFTLHNVPYMHIGDQSFFWEYAYRMLQGDHVYRDFFQFTPPGADLFYLVLFKLLGPSYAVADLGVILLGLALFAACFSVACRILSRNQALFAAATIMVLIFGERLDGTHHWFSLTLSLCAVHIVMPGRTPLRMIAGGALCGLAAFFTQTAGVAALITLLLALLWEHITGGKSRKETSKLIAMLVAAYVLVWLALSAHFILSAGWQKFFFLQVTYPQRYVHENYGFLVPDDPAMMHLRSWPRLLRQLGVYAMLAIPLPVLWHCWRTRQRPGTKNSAQQNDFQIVLLALLGLLLMLQMIARPNWNRIYGVAPPALILLTWAIVRFTNDSFRRLVAIVAACAIVCLAIAQTRGRQNTPHQIANLPSGSVALPPTQYEEDTWIGEHTRPGDTFFQAYLMDVFIPLGLRNPVFAEELLPNERTRPEMVALTVRQLEEKQVEYILWSPQSSNPNRAKTPGSDHLEPLRAYIRSHYTKVHVFFNQDEIWRRL